jgi:hypothetical protein
MHPIILTAGLLLSLAPALAAADSAVLLDSGSTNTAGFRIEVNRSGEAVYTPPPRRGRQPSEEQPKPRNRRIPSPLIKRFFADLDAQRPFSALPNRGCMKSVSFGTTLTVEYQGERTPDLRCGDHGHAGLKALIQDTGEIIGLFNSQ